MEAHDASDFSETRRPVSGNRGISAHMSKTLGKISAQRDLKALSQDLKGQPSISQRLSATSQTNAETFEIVDSTSQITMKAGQEHLRCRLTPAAG